MKFNIKTSAKKFQQKIMNGFNNNLQLSERLTITYNKKL